MARPPPPSAFSASSDAFPHATYAKYKRATSYFLMWLLRARNDGVVVQPDANVKRPLDVYDRMVAAIAKAPTALSPVMLQLLPHALDACQTAITLRTRVALFLADTADDKHAHFLDRLKHWWTSLKNVSVSLQQKPQTLKVSEKCASDGRVGKRVDFSNYYDVLALPDDYFSDDASDSLARPVVHTLSAADQKRLIDEAFAQDLDAELACLFMELDELSESVYAVFHDVKREKKTLLEATAVAKVAIDCAETVIAKLQLQYPSVKSAEDVRTVIQDRMSVTVLGGLLSRVEQAWDTSGDDASKDEIRYRYVPGTILIDLIWVSNELQLFASGARGRSQQMLNPDVSFCGQPYCEHETPHYTVPYWGYSSPFFLQQLAFIHNALVDFEQLDVSVDGVHLEMWFFKPFDALRKTGTVTLHLTFICICWIRSVAALQGNRGLGRTTSLSILYRWDLAERLDQLLGNLAEPLQAVDKFIDDIRATKGKIRRLREYGSLHRLNPILAGCVQIDLHFKFLELGNDSLLLTPFFRAFCHIYSALRNRRMIDEIPFVEGIIQVYEAGLFSQSHTTTTHGSYAQSYLAANKLFTASFYAQYVRKTTDERKKTAFSRGRLIHLSPAFRLLYANDFSVLPTSLSQSSSWKSLLCGVSDVFTVDLFDSRVLSRDMLSFTQKLSVIFHELCDQLGRRQQFERMLADTSPRVVRGLAVGRALENAVVFPLLPFLDGLTDDEIREHANEVVEADTASTSNTSVSRVALCRRASRLIARHLGSIHNHARYFVFPPSPAWVSIEFGNLIPVDSESRQTVEDEFCDLMEMMESSSGPLCGKTLTEFKRRVLEAPQVLRLGLTNPFEEFNTLLHHCAAGPAHDRRLTEWLIQVGALEEESPHCRFPSEAEKSTLSVSWNTLAVHRAAERGLTDIVKIILEAGNWRDINTPTYRTKESLVHIAVKTDNRDLYRALISVNADVSGKDAQGNHVWELTKNRAWKSSIKRLAAFGDKRSENVKQQQMIADANPKRLRTISPPVQRDGVRTGSATLSGSSILNHSNPATSTAGLIGATKKHKKKKRKKEVPVSSASAVASASALMDQLFVSERSRPGDEAHRTERLALALETLRHGVVANPTACEESARIVIEIVIELSTFVQSVLKVSLGMLSKVSAHVSELHEAARAVFSLVDLRNSKAQSIIIVGEPKTEVDKLLLMLEPADDGSFRSMYDLTIMCATMLAWCGETATPEKLVALGERWLLQIKERSDRFRDMVVGYINARHASRLKPPMGSTRNAERQFQWYRSKHGVEDVEVLAKLDRLWGCSHYVKLSVDGGLATPRAKSWAALVKRTPYADEIIWHDGMIISGARSLERLADILTAIVDALTLCDMAFVPSMSLVDVALITFAGFTFSTDGILPIA